MTMGTELCRDQAEGILRWLASYSYFRRIGKSFEILSLNEVLERGPGMLLILVEAGQRLWGYTPAQIWGTACTALFLRTTH